MNLCRPRFNPETIELRLRELAYLNSSATIRFRATGKKTPDSEWKEFHFDGGIQEFVAWINRSKTALHDPLFVSKKVSVLDSKQCRHTSGKTKAP